MPSSERLCTPKAIVGNPSRWLGTVLIAAIPVMWPACDGFAADAARPPPAPCGERPSPADVVILVNAARARGAACTPARLWPAVEPLTWNPLLAEVAELQSREMATLAHIAHHDTHDQDLAQRLRNSGYSFSIAAENVAVGYPSVDAVIEAWLASESHCVNIMNAGVREFGVACVDGHTLSEPAQERYWTMVVGKPKPARAQTITAVSDARP